MTRSQAEEVLLDAGWLEIMFRDMPDKKVISSATAELAESAELVKHFARRVASKERSE